MSTLLSHLLLSCLCFFTAPPTTEIYTLSLHDALPISDGLPGPVPCARAPPSAGAAAVIITNATASISTPAAAVRHRSEEHTSELQSHSDLVCRLLLEKKNKNTKYNVITSLQQHSR